MRAREDVFLLFLLSTLVVDSTTIRGTSGKHRVPFNWANFLSSLEKLHPLTFYTFRLPFPDRPSGVSGGSEISERFP